MTSSVIKSSVGRSSTHTIHISILVTELRTKIRNADLILPQDFRRNITTFELYQGIDISILWSGSLIFRTYLPTTANCMRRRTLNWNSLATLTAIVSVLNIARQKLHLDSIIDVRITRRSFLSGDSGTGQKRRFKKSSLSLSIYRSQSWNHRSPRWNMITGNRYRTPRLGSC